MRRDEAAAWEKVGRNMTLLREGLFSTLDHLFDADRETLEELEEFATHLMGGKETQDEGVFRLIHRALLSLARQKGDRYSMIRELYWLGMGYYWLYSKLVGLPLEVTEKYANQMRLSFTEAAAYLKYFEEIEDTETRGYMLRSRANMSLGSFKSSGEKIRLVRDTLCIMQDESYRQTEPDLPWERYLYMTHQQMASSVSYSKEQVMSPEDMAWIMESAYIVYHQRLEEAAASGGHTPLRWAFPYYAMEYYCGIYDMDHLMARIEKLMDQADPADVSPDGMYGILSLPAFYGQYLEQNPERIPAKASYLEGLYRRAGFPPRRTRSCRCTCGSCRSRISRHREAYPTGCICKSCCSASRRRRISTPGWWGRRPGLCAGSSWRRSPPSLTTWSSSGRSTTRRPSAARCWMTP